MTRRLLALSFCLLAAALLTGAADLLAQAGPPIVRRSENRPLDSLARAAALAPVPPLKGGVREIPNFRGAPKGVDATEGDPLVQTQIGFGPTSVDTYFEGTDNEGNLSVLGFRVAPPDTDGDVGPNHYVQMINLVTTVFDHSGNIVPGGGPFGSNAYWAGQGGNCEPFNQGDPVVVYDDQADRWLVSQFAFDDNFTTFSQCVAISQTGNPLGAYNRYEFSFDGIGFPDYPKHGIVTGSITMMANLFTPPLFNFGGTFIGAMDKAAMYAGTSASLIGFNLGVSEFGFVAGDLDGPGTATALFGTAMSRNRRFDIWEIIPNFGAGTATATRIKRQSISTFDSDLCGASREACITQPNGGPSLEALSDRLMHRLQIRDFGSYRTMLAAHTVDVGGGRAGIRWYEMRQSGGGTWSLHQSGTYAPNDGQNRWVPSIAMNAGGDIGLGFLVSSTSTPMSVHLTGQTAANSGTGTMDADEVVCRAGVTEQTGTARSGDYAATNVLESTGKFWHTNEYGQRNDKSAGWGTAVCQFSLTAPTCTDNDGDGYGNPGSAACPNGAATDCNDGVAAINPGVAENCTNGIDDDCDGLIDGADPECQACTPQGGSCSSSAECCDGLKCKGGPGGKTCKP